MKKASKYYGKKIVDASQIDDKIHLVFEDGTKVDIFDRAQYCCESRYLTCDDNFDNIINGNLKNIRVSGTDSECPDLLDCHDTKFVTIDTDKGFITLCTHNEHNGYYGGFELVIEKCGR